MFKMILLTGAAWTGVSIVATLVWGGLLAQHTAARMGRSARER